MIVELMSPTERKETKVRMNTTMTKRATMIVMIVMILERMKTKMGNTKKAAARRVRVSVKRAKCVLFCKA